MSARNANQLQRSVRKNQRAVQRNQPFYGEMYQIQTQHLYQHSAGILAEEENKRADERGIAEEDGEVAGTSEDTGIFAEYHEDT